MVVVVEAEEKAEEKAEEEAEELGVTGGAASKMLLVCGGGAPKGNDD